MQVISITQMDKGLTGIYFIQNQNSFRIHGPKRNHQHRYKNERYAKQIRYFTWQIITLEADKCKQI
jgi:hypothetical protein